MAHEYIITLTDNQTKAITYLSANPQEWIQNAILGKANMAMAVMAEAEIERLTAAGLPVPETRDEIIANSTLVPIR
jgi:hypothetical protein